MSEPEHRVCREYVSARFPGEGSDCGRPATHSVTFHSEDKKGGGTVYKCQRHAGMYRKDENAVVKEINA